MYCTIYLLYLLYHLLQYNLYMYCTIYYNITCTCTVPSTIYHNITCTSMVPSTICDTSRIMYMYCTYCTNYSAYLLYHPPSATYNLYMYCTTCMCCPEQKPRQQSHDCCRLHVCMCRRAYCVLSSLCTVFISSSCDAKLFVDCS
jgi:hypothetical protein